jgi:hypothetical protein
MPTQDEVQAVLDVLFLSKSISMEYEHLMRLEEETHTKISPIRKLMGERPKRGRLGSSKAAFDLAFRDLVHLALEKAEEVRSGKKAIEVYPINAHVVQVASGNWGIEFFLGELGLELVDGFNLHWNARAWAISNWKEYSKKKGVPEGTKLFIVGDYP